MRPVGNRVDIFQRAKKAGLLNNHRGDVVAGSLLQGIQLNGAAGAIIINLDQLDILPTDNGVRVLR